MTVTLSKKLTVNVASFAEAVQAVRKSIGTRGSKGWYGSLPHGETGATIRVNGAAVAVVSYNGRVWDATNSSKEITV